MYIVNNTCPVQDASSCSYAHCNSIYSSVKLCGLIFSADVLMAFTVTGQEAVDSNVVGKNEGCFSVELVRV